MHLSSWQLAGGGSARGRSKRKSEIGVGVGNRWEGGGGGVWWEAYAAGESSKVQTCLMDSPLLFDSSLENWSRHPSSCLPFSAHCSLAFDCGRWYWGVSWELADTSSHLVTGKGAGWQNWAHLFVCKTIWVTVCQSYQNPSAPLSHPMALCRFHLKFDCNCNNMKVFLIFYILWAPCWRSSNKL